MPIARHPGGLLYFPSESLFLSSSTIAPFFGYYATKRRMFAMNSRSSFFLYFFPCNSPQGLLHTHYLFFLHLVTQQQMDACVIYDMVADISVPLSLIMLTVLSTYLTFRLLVIGGYEMIVCEISDHIAFYISAKSWSTTKSCRLAEKKLVTQL
jgi:hypothetical protein